MNPFKVVQTEKASPQTQEATDSRAKYERLWFQHPKRFDATRNAMERDRVKRAIDYIASHYDLTHLKIADIGCGSAPISSPLASRGAEVIAVDIAENALKTVPRTPHLIIDRTALPQTNLPDDTYDLCLATEVIAELNHKDFRLAIAEFCRVIKPEGNVYLSTPIDIYSEDALERFLNLAETEFRIESTILRHHSYYLKLLHFLKSPSKFSNAWRDPAKRKLGLECRRGFSSFWFRINSTPLLAILWTPISWILSPLVYLVEQSPWIMLPLEKMCKLIQGDRGISHATFVGKRRPLLEDKKEPPLPDRAPFRKEVRWE